MKFFLPLLLAIPCSISAYVPGYQFVVNGHPLHANGFYRQTGPLKFTEPTAVKDSAMTYRDAQASVFYTTFINEKNAISVELGENYLDLDWDKNPRFAGKVYTTTKATIAYITTKPENWRLVAAVGGMVDSESFDFSKTALGYGWLWGRYTFNDRFNGHIGGMVQSGIGETKVMPIVGFDAKVTEKLKMTLIYPIQASATLSLTENWALLLSGSSLGDFVKIPMRAKDGTGPLNQDAIFSLHGTGVDLNLLFNYKGGFVLIAGAGYQLPGTLSIRDKDGKTQQNYKFNGAPYGQVRLYLTL